MLISDEYRQLNAGVHDRVPGWGILKDVDLQAIKQIAAVYKPQSILDYGCGKGRLGKILPNVQSYDPAIPEFAAEPQPADFVVCTATLEHIEPEFLDDVLDELQFLTWKVIMLTVDMHPSSHVLKDGRNAHLIQENAEWWLPKLLQRWRIRSMDVGRRNFTFVGTVS
jgi:hypothetical protein